MTQEGATIYYSLKQTYNFIEVCKNLQKLGLCIKNTNTQVITGILSGGGDFENTSFEKAQALFNSKDFGFYLWLENGHMIFWSSVKNENYFFHNFAFNSLDGDEIEQAVSQSFIKFALQELKNNNSNFLGDYEMSLLSEELMDLELKYFLEGIEITEEIKQEVYYPEMVRRGYIDILNEL